MTAIEDAREALAKMDRIGEDGWCLCVKNGAQTEVRDAIAALIAEHEQRTTADASAEAFRRYDGDTVIDDNTGEPTSFDDWGYAETARRAFVDGAQWAVGR